MRGRFASVERVLQNALAEKCFTAAVARIEFRGVPVFERAFGVTRDDAPQPIVVDTAFDLASITKVFVSTEALAAVSEGLLDLDEPLVRWFTQWKGTAHEPITLRMLLAHTSGMNSGADYRQLLGSNVVEFALRRELVARPGEGVIYSDLGFIALGELLQRVRGRSLHAMLPGYNPRPTSWATIPATEDDGWRGRVQGYVHDEKAYLMGGIAGHAGLFGTASDVARLGERYLAACLGRASSLDAALAREAVREQATDQVLRRGLGWALKTSDENSCGSAFSFNSFGHTGFVGTCIWVDPDADINAVLLTNSVYFGRSDTRYLRAAFYDATAQALRYA